MKEELLPTRAFLVNQEHLEPEFKAFGLEHKAGQAYQHSHLTVVVRICRIPVSVKPLLEKITLANRGDIIFSASGSNLFNTCEALLVGTGSQIEEIITRLKLLDNGAAKIGRVLSEALSRSYKFKPDHIILGEYSLPLCKRTLIMGILNVTPDSFSDGGRFDRIDAALEQAYRMAEEGADIIDIGGESTRPGHDPVSIDEEISRVIPVIRALKGDRSFKLPLSVDTYKAEVATKAVELGVEMINDVWGMKGMSSVGPVAARHNLPVCLMHNRSSSGYDNLIPDIICELLGSVEQALLAGIKEEHIIIDPGIGFGKGLTQNLEVMKHLNLFCSLGYPVLLGTSRKSMIGKTLNLPVEERVEGTAATVAVGIQAGVDIIRVHDVKEMRRVAAMTDAICRR